MPGVINLIKKYFPVVDLENLTQLICRLSKNKYNVIQVGDEISMMKQRVY